MTTTSQLIDILNNNMNNTLTCRYDFLNGVSFIILSRDTAPYDNRYYIRRTVNGEVRSAGFREDEWGKFYNLLVILVVDDYSDEEEN